MDKGENRAQYDPIIITGMWHAGTRMLVDILETAGIDFGRKKNALGNKNNDFVDDDFNRFCQNLLLRENLKPDVRDKERVEAILRRYFDFTRPWGIKMPILSYVIPYFVRLYPRCRAIGIIRDARDVCLSGIGIGVPTRKPACRDFGSFSDLLRFYFSDYREWARFKKVKERCYFGTQKIKEFAGVRLSSIGSGDTRRPPRLDMFAAKLWLESTSHLIGNRGDPHYHEVRYEDICVNPQKEISQILSHVGIAQYDDLEALAQIPRTSRIGKWKDVEARIVRDIESIAGPLLKELGYM